MVDARAESVSSVPSVRTPRLSPCQALCFYFTSNGLYCICTGLCLFASQLQAARSASKQGSASVCVSSPGVCMRVPQTHRLDNNSFAFLH